MAIGFIYVLSNEAMPGLLKIGYTLSDVAARARDLSTSTGVPKPFQIEYWLLAKDVEELEGKIHAKLEKFRVSQSREFFVGDLTGAIKIIEELAAPAPARFLRSVSAADLPNSSNEKDTKKVLVQICRICGYSRSLDIPTCPKCGDPMPGVWLSV